MIQDSLLCGWARPIGLWPVLGISWSWGQNLPLPQWLISLPEGCDMKLGKKIQSCRNFVRSVWNYMQNVQQCVPNFVKFSTFPSMNSSRCSGFYWLMLPTVVSLLTHIPLLLLLIAYYYLANRVPNFVNNDTHWWRHEAVCDLGRLFMLVVLHPGNLIQINCRKVTDY